MVPSSPPRIRDLCSWYMPVIFPMKQYLMSLPLERQQQTHTSETIPLEICNALCQFLLSCCWRFEYAEYPALWLQNFLLICYKPENKKKITWILRLKRFCQFMYLLWNTNDLNTRTSSNTLGIVYLCLWWNVLAILPTSQIGSRSNYCT